MHKDTSGAIFCKQICQTHFGAKSAKPEFGKFYELGLLIILIRVKLEAPLLASINIVTSEQTVEECRAADSRAEKSDHRNSGGVGWFVRLFRPT